MPTTPSKDLEAIPNPRKDGLPYTVSLHTDEFTCVCPRTGQPDFASITITYIPNNLLVESKALKLYLWTFREEGHFHEEVTNIIRDDLVTLLQPKELTVRGLFNVRGGIGIEVVTSYRE